MIKNHPDGIKSTTLKQMEELFEYTCSRDEFLNPLLAERLAYYTSLLNKEISVYIARDGSIADVSIGEADKVSMPNMRLTRGENGLCGVRCVHTHPEGSYMLSSVDLGTMIASKLDAMAALGVMGGISTGIGIGTISGIDNGQFTAAFHGPFHPNAINNSLIFEAIELADRIVKDYSAPLHVKEKAILIGIETGREEVDMEELSMLTDTAGAEVVKSIIQKRDHADNTFYIGKGKAEEIALLIQAIHADICICNDELDALQLRNLENTFGVKTIDRTALILDIFSSRAMTHEGKLQVELAQLKYRLPRLIGMGLVLSRQGAGIGTRGPGEKKLEIDRRRIRRRIFELESALDEVKKQRDIRRSRREKNEVPVVALVGYTNAGKSTLLNALCGSEALVEDKLFATLDPITKRASFDSEGDYLMTDTVGFIDRLPHQLISAFKSTLEEVKYADLLLHVIDISNANYDLQVKIVEDVLSQLGAGDTPCIKVYNKIDKLETEPSPKNGKKSVFISADKKIGLNELCNAVRFEIEKQKRRIRITIPFDKGSVTNLLRNKSKIIEEKYSENGTEFLVLIDEASYRQILAKLEE